MLKLGKRLKIPFWVEGTFDGYLDLFFSLDLDPEFFKFKSRSHFSSLDLGLDLIFQRPDVDVIFLSINGSVSNFLSLDVRPLGCE